MFDFLNENENTVGELKSFFDKVLRVIAPEELKDIDQNIASAFAFATATASTIGQDQDELRVMGVVEGAVLSLHIIAGTLSLLEIYHVRKQQKENEICRRELQKAWEDALVEAGVPRDIAKEIPVKCLPEFIQFIVAQRLGKFVD